MADPQPSNGEVTGTWASFKKSLSSKFEGFKDAITTSIITYLTGLAAALFYAGNVYAKPQLLGILLIGIGLVGTLVVLKRRVRGEVPKSNDGQAAETNKTKWWLGLIATVPILVIGIGVTLWHQTVLRWELEYVSSFDVKRQLKFGIGESLDLKTLSKSTHGGIPRVSLLQIGPFRSSGRRLAIDDDSGLNVNKQEAAIRAEASELADLIPWRNPTQGRTLNFLIAPAGSGKETILRQWVYAYGKDRKNHEFTHVFLLTKEDMVRAIDAVEKGDPYKELSLQNVMATAYTGIVDDPQYYDLLFRNEPCLIVIPEWDVVLAKLDKPERKADFLHRIIDVVASDDYQISVLIGSRPPAILRDFSIDNANTFRFETFLRFLEILPLDKEEWTPFFRRRELQLLPASKYYNACQLIDKTGGSAGVPGSLAGNLEFLNLEVDESDELRALDYYSFARRLTQRALERDTGITDEKQFTGAFTTLSDLAYQASKADTYNLEFSGRLTREQNQVFSTSPFADIKNGEFVFSPRAVHSYFALEGLRNTLRENGTDHCALMSDTLAQDLALFAPLPHRLDDMRQAITCSLRDHASEYKESTKRLLSKTLAESNPTASLNLDCGPAP